MAANSWTKPFTNLVGAAAGYYNGHPQNKPSHSSYQNIPNPAYAQSTPLQPSTGHDCKPPSGSVSHHRKTYQKLKRNLKIVVTFSVAVSTLLTLFMEGSMIYMTYKWFKTRNMPASDNSRSSPWAKDSVVWPTYMLLGASVVTFVLCFATLIALCCRSRKKTMFSLLYNIVHIGVWAVVAIMYRVYKTEKDLWGWSCSPKADAIQHLYEGKVDFHGLCSLQSGDWYASVGETGLKVVCTALGWYLKARGSRVRRFIVNEIGDAGFEDFFN